MKGKISIIVPVYNVQEYLNECVNSVLKQSYENLELILVDDGSTDGCSTMCDEFAIKDARVRVIHKPNGGLSDARNIGLLQAKGKYVCFLDSDDYYNNIQFFEKVIDRFEMKPVDILCHQRQRFIDGTPETMMFPEPYNRFEIEEVNYGALIESLSSNDRLDANASMKFFKRSFLVDNDLFFKKGIVSEDIEWFMRVLLKAQSMAVTNEVGYCYRLRTTSISHNIKFKNVQDLFSSIENYAVLYEHHEDAALRAGVLNYLSYQYFIVLGYIRSNLSDEERSIMIKKLKSYKWIVRYAINKKTKMCAFLYRCFGLNLTAIVLGKYMKIKK